MANILSLTEDTPMHWLGSINVPSSRSHMYSCMWRETLSGDMKFHHKPHFYLIIAQSWTWAKMTLVRVLLPYISLPFYATNDKFSTYPFIQLRPIHYHIIRFYWFLNGMTSETCHRCNQSPQYIQQPLKIPIKTYWYSPKTHYRFLFLI